MPKLKKTMPAPSIEIEVTLHEFLQSCASAEKSELFRILLSSGYAYLSGIDRNVGFKKGPRGGKKSPDKSISHQEFSSACYLLAKNYHRLSKEEEETLIEISKKF
jgi:hypothetical protein